MPHREIGPSISSILTSVDNKLLERHVLYGSTLFDFARENVIKYPKHFDYVFIDEFQDTQPLQIELLQYFMQNNAYVIGDPRQSIYGFLGGSTYFINYLNRHLRGVRKLQLINNYRSQKRIVDAANSFARGYPRVKTPNASGNPVTLIAVNNELMDQALVVDYVKEIIGDETLLVLGRYGKSDPIHKGFIEGYRQLAGNDYKTFHGSKGLESENVLIIGCNEWTDPKPFDTVPSRQRDHPLKQVIRSRKKKGSLDNDEERRLFYVAMTRAKKRLFIAYSAGQQSRFINELKRDKRNVICINL